MPLHNSEIANMFERLADLLEIEDANPFRVRAYRNAARTIRGYPRNMADLVQQEQDLSQIPNIGHDLAAKIQTLVQTGRLPLFDRVRARTPAALGDLMHIKGLGPRRVQTLYRELGIKTPEDLKRAARSGRIRDLKGFGRKTEQTIKEAMERFSGKAPRTKLVEAEDIAEPLADYLKKGRGIKDVVVAGSYRRRKETVGDLDILVTAKKGSDVMQRFVDYDEVEEVVSRGETRCTVRLRSGLSVDLRVVPQVSYGAALHYFTGSRAHNIVVRRMAAGRGLKINEYGVFREDERVAGRTEKAVYEQVDLPYIEPELRENRGELEAARKGRLPALITLQDIRGDLHCHTKASDGHQTLREMAQAAADRGYEYLSINDHSKHVTIANGLDAERLLQQIRAIDELNDRLDGIVLLKSSEVDILEDGSLDLPDSVLRELDFTVCSVHYGFDQPRKKQTERILRAMDNPCFNILAHPTGRLINEREPYDIDLEGIMRAAVERGCFLELNAHPDRLDLSDEACKMARDMGLKIAISTDAHSDSGLDFMRFGINQARRGWLTPDDVINTRPLQELRRLFERK